MTNNNPVYVLLKDLPEADAGTELSFNKKAKGYFGKDKYGYTLHFSEEYMAKHNLWFKKKEEPIKERVVELRFGIIGFDEEGSTSYIQMAESKLPAVKEAISQVLNPNTDTWTSEFPKEESIIQEQNNDIDYNLKQRTDTQVEKEEEIQQEKLYTERELLEAESKAFYAARGRISWNAKELYPTFSDYKDSQQNKNQ